jgi:hypothetical protein
VTFAVFFLVGLGIGWIGRDLWQLVIDLFEIWREES